MPISNEKIKKWFFPLSMVILILLNYSVVKAESTKGEGTVQQAKVSGTVSDSEGIPLPGVTVLEKGTTNGTVTNTDGKYILPISQKESTIIFSFVGMKTKEVKYTGQSNINVTMEGDAIGLDEVVAIGYGKQSRRLVTTSISKVNGETLAEQPVTSVGAAIQGKISGVNIYSSNYAPGDSPNIRIRGGSSISMTNSPLVIIDGMPRSMEDINYNDVESIEILKDAAATAVYGARASNGVVLISTKTGKVRQKPVITFETSFTTSSARNQLNQVSAAEYINLVRPALVGTDYEYTLTAENFPQSSGNSSTSCFTTRYLEDGETIPDGWSSTPDPLDPSKTLIFQENDPWETLTKTGMLQNYYLSASGGSENIRYAGSIGYTKDEGVIIESGWERFSGKMNVEFDLSDKLSLNTGFGFTKSHTEDEPNWRDAIQRQLIMAPMFRYYYDDGTPSPGFNSTATPPNYWRETRDYDEYLTQTDINGSLIWKPLKGLSLRANASYYRRDFENEYFEKAHYWSSSRRAYANQDLTQKRQLEAIASYETKINNAHNLSFMAGFSDLFVETRDIYLYAYGGSTDIIPTLNAAPNKLDASTAKTEEALIGMFGRLNYSYLNRYLLQASIRRDGSSRFGTNNKWGIFPGVSLGWIVSEESFLAGITPISNLKLRGSYGLTGNNNIGLYTSQGSYSVSDKYAGNAAIIASTMPNQNLGWEKTKQFDIGFDLGLYNQRFSLVFDYYNKVTEDLLFSKPLPNTTGFSSITTNIGSVKFYGFEFDINASIIKKKDFAWDATFVYSYNKNRVLSLPDNGVEKNRIDGIVDPNGEDVGGYAEGESLYSITGYKVDYIIDNQEQADNALYDENARGYNPTDGTTVKGRKFPGDYEWVDKNGDEEINTYDQVVLGYSMPHSTGGLQNNFAYKNFTLSINMDYAIGHSAYDQVRRHTSVNGFVCRSRPLKAQLTAWQQEGDAAHTEYAKFWVQDPVHQQNYGRKSDINIFRLDYLCLREIKLMYDLPSKYLNNVGIKGLKAYISGNNLTYFTKDERAKETNPEWGTSTTYSTSAGYPSSVKFTFGFKVTL